MSPSRILSRPRRYAPARAGAAFAFTGPLLAAGLIFSTAVLHAMGAGPPKGGPHDARFAYADGAPPGFSGGFDEQSCHGCHFSAEPNTPPGEVKLEGVPERFTPGEKYPITIALSRAGMKVAGFQFAGRFADGGAQAGTLAAGADDGERVKVETQSAVQYASQTRMGAEVSGTGAARWTVVWTAPTDARPVQFHVSANAADGDESAQGDYVYTSTAEAAPAGR